MKRKIIFLSVLLLFGVCLVSAQQISVSGVVTDASDGSPVVGASIKVKGTKSGTVSDLNGKFSLSAEEGATLVFSYIGMIKQEITVKSKIVNVKMATDSHTLNEVVAIGYGVQKKKLVTGATVQVSGDNLQKLSTTSAFTALQSQAPGINITQTSGQPGEGFKVNIRGINTIGNSNPLYVIDGVAGGDLNSLNNSDIESIDVLKDAATAAIYGARAANGVILITTKQGKSGKIQVSLDSYLGVQNVYKMASPLNAQQYIAIRNEVDYNEGVKPNDWKSILGSRYASVMDGSWKGTNWLDEMRNENAPTQSHAINITGGNETSKFSTGVAFTSQEGIFGSPVASKYNRTTFRLNSDHVLIKSAGRDVLKFGQTLNYGYSTKNGVGIGNKYWNDISNMLRAMPIMPVYNDKGKYFDNADKTAMGLNGYEPMMGNPIADMVYNRGYNTNKSHRLFASANIQYMPIKNLTIKSQFGYKMNANSYRSYKPEYALSTTMTNTVSSVSQNLGLNWSYTVDNTANYILKFEKHTFDAMIGQSIEKWGMGEDVSVTNGNLLFNDFEHAYVTNSQGIVSGQTKVSGNPAWPGGLSSFFGRVNYNYNETYMASLIMRNDKSSNFIKGKRGGYFPSVSAGWVMTNEKFMEPARDIVDFFKVRASWGQNGNCDINAFNYISNVAFDQTAKYSFGNDKTQQSTGGIAKNIPNPDTKWEAQVQTNLGFDARFLNSRLNVNFDYYNKSTSGWLLQVPIPDYYGVGQEGAPFVNGGDVRNRGVEVVLGWNDKVGKDFTYNVNVNAAFNKNEVTFIDNPEGIIRRGYNDFAQGTSDFYRAQVGQPLGAFWGYKTAGVFQNQAEIDAWKAAGNGFAQSNPQPGDLKFVDANKDGKVTDLDKAIIGNPNPDMNLGFTLNVGYKGFDLTVVAHGAFGMQIMKNYRQTSRNDNYTTDVFNRWHGEGTSNKYPRLTSNTHVNYMNISDMYIENGDYLKIQNLSLGYDFKKLYSKLPFTQIRLYCTAQNLFTITKYSGMDPEVGATPGSDSWSTGVDIGMYPSARTYLVGLNVKF